MERYLFIGIGVLMLCIFSVMLRMYFSPWLRCRIAGYPIGLPELMYVVMKGAKTDVVADAYLVARKAGVPASVADLTKLYLASPAQFAEQVRRLIQNHVRR